MTVLGWSIVDPPVLGPSLVCRLHIVALDGTSLRTLMAEVLVYRTAPDGGGVQVHLGRWVLYPASWLGAGQPNADHALVDGQ